MLADSERIAQYFETVPNNIRKFGLIRLLLEKGKVDSNLELILVQELIGDRESESKFLWDVHYRDEIQTALESIELKSEAALKLLVRALRLPLDRDLKERVERIIIEKYPSNAVVQKSLEGQLSDANIGVRNRAARILSSIRQLNEKTCRVLF